MEKASHEQEIVASRVGGFGGSDAHMLVGIAQRLKQGQPLGWGQVTRLKIAKGLAEPSLFSTPETEAGHVFEDQVAATLPPMWHREVRMEQRLSKKFQTFAHADFMVPVMGAVKECKWTRSRSLNGLLSYYRWQLQWYYMMGAKSVSLCYCISKGDGPLDTGTVDVPEDKEAQRQLIEAVHILDEMWDEIPLEAPIFGADDDRVPKRVAAALAVIRDARRAIEAAKMEKDAAEEVVLDWMEQQHAKGINMADGTYVGYRVPGTQQRFDTSRFRVEHPDMFAAYTKMSETKGGLTWIE